MVWCDLQKPVQLYFYSPAPFGNATNEKSLYAFSITPLERMSREELVKQPDDTTEFPFGAVEKTSAEQVTDSKQEQFFFGDLKRKSDGMDERVKKVAKVGYECFFLV